MIKISHSARGKFVECPRKYYYHYKEKLRSPKLGSALFFGNALDDAFSRLLLDKKATELTDDEKKMMELSPEQIYEQKMLEAKNEAGQIVAIPQSPLADYYSSDFSPELFTAEIVGLVEKVDKNLDSLAKITKFMESAKYNLNFRNKDRKRLSDDEFQLYNYINWLSLFEKGKLMLQAYKRDILPQIAKVYAIQKEIAITSDLGDVIVGKIDVIASFVDQPDVPFICDNKTSSTAYSDDSVRQSEQLATYAEAEQNFNCAYLVVQKKLYKKSPQIHTQIIKDVVSVNTIEKTFDNFAEICENIEGSGELLQNYPKNEQSCFNFGKVCPYYQICKHNTVGNLVDCKSKDGKK